jgi:mRNA interferase MazF
MAIKRGEVYYANLDPVIGNETGKTRPVLVLQNDIGNQFSSTTIVAVVTEFSEKKASYPICVVIPAESGLRRRSIANLAQIRTIDRQRLRGDKIAALSSQVMREVDQALMYSLGLKTEE